jgi:hypothetical protein
MNVAQRPAAAAHLEYCVPLLQPDLLRSRPDLGRDELLEVPYRVVLIALDPHLLPQAVIADDLQHRAARAAVRCGAERVFGFFGLWQWQ